jgi:hypothetical protein
MAWPGGGPWPFVAGASVQGSHHLASGRENQDAFHSSVTGDGRAIVLAIADGAGSRPRAALGSQLAVDVACRRLTCQVPEADRCVADWQSWLSAAGQSVITDYLRVAAAAGPVSELAATLTAVIICPPWAGFLSIGDCFGAVITGGPPGRCQLVAPPEADAGFTYFLSSPSAEDKMRSVLIRDPELSGVVLATDGCAALAFDHPAHHGLPPSAGPQPAAGFFIGLADAVRASQGDAAPIHRLLTSEQAARCADDLTVLCALTAAG